MRQVYALYGRGSAATRAFIRGRVFLSDMGFIEEQVPANGRIVDVGCGHGLFSNLMAVGSAERRITGIDIDPDKIEEARQTVAARSNLDFVCGDVLVTGIPDCDVITIVDVMYLLPPDSQLAVLRKCSESLDPGGLLVWKAQETRPRWKFAWTYLQEMLATAIGLTRGRHGARLYFLSREEALDTLEEAGFAAEAIRMRSWRPYSDVLYLGRKVA